jgi:ATP-dependent RNA helicase RhlB
MNETPEPIETPEVEAPVQRAQEPKFLTETRFIDFELPLAVTDGLDAAGFVYCTPIQAHTLPVTLSGRDVAGQAQTGTGKTAAFLVTIFTRLLAMTERPVGLPAALIVSPTRELASQIYDEARSLGRFVDLGMALIVGGVDYQKQAECLKKGTDIVIGTPGRIIDYYKQKIFNTEAVKIVVIDEADRLLDLGFAKDMRFILRSLPSYKLRQSMLFSATLSHRVLELTYEYMNLPEFIAVTPEEVTVEGISQSLFHVGKEKKLGLLLGLLAREDWSRLLIFVNTKSGVEWLAKKLKGNGHPAEAITGDLPQNKRFALMNGFKNGSIKILVATDVASRGIHVEDVSHVINYDLPQDAENYVHRIGRTARAGKTGRAISLACDEYIYHLEAIEAMLGQKIPVIWPEDDWFLADKAGPVSTSDRKPFKRGERQPHKSVRGPTAAKTRPPRHTEKIRPKRPSGYYPGSFFGFGPAEPVQIEPGDGAEPKVSESPPAHPSGPTEEAVTAKRKRRRPRRGRGKRRTDTENPEGTALASPILLSPDSDTTI